MKENNNYDDACVKSLRSWGNLRKVEGPFVEEARRMSLALVHVRQEAYRYTTKINPTCSLFQHLETRVHSLFHVELNSFFSPLTYKISFSEQYSGSMSSRNISVVIHERILEHGI